MLHHKSLLLVLPPATLIYAIFLIIKGGENLGRKRKFYRETLIEEILLRLIVVEGHKLWYLERKAVMGIFLFSIRFPYKKVLLNLRDETLNLRSCFNLDSP